jgi:hypothetical protein
MGFQIQTGIFSMAYWGWSGYIHFTPAAVTNIMQYEKFKDTKTEIRSRNWKDRNTITQIKSTNNDVITPLVSSNSSAYKTLHRKLKIEQYRSH